MERWLKIMAAATLLAPALAPAGQWYATQGLGSYHSEKKIEDRYWQENCEPRVKNAPVFKYAGPPTNPKIRRQHYDCRRPVGGNSWNALNDGAGLEYRSGGGWHQDVWSFNYMAEDSYGKPAAWAATGDLFRARIPGLESYWAGLGAVAGLAYKPGQDHTSSQKYELAGSVYPIGAMIAEIASDGGYGLEVAYIPGARGGRDNGLSTPSVVYAQLRIPIQSSEGEKRWKQGQNTLATTRQLAPDSSGW